MRTRLLLTLLTLGCDGPLVATDASTPAIDGGVDAGSPPIDPSTARFVETPTEGEGPWTHWGYMAVAIDASRAIVIGGTDAGLGGLVFADAWRVEVTPAAITAQRIDATGPMPRYCGCAAYDPERDVVVVYGGRDLSVSAFAPETWELSLTSGTWTPIPGAIQPAGTLGCAMAHLPANGRVYLFGGADGAGVYDAIYVYEGDAWRELPAEGPVARYDPVLFPSHDGRTLSLFGGSYGARGAAFYSDLWSFDPTSETWTEVALPLEAIPGRRTAWVVRDPERAGLYVGFGYDGMMQPLGDLWYADLDALTWTPIEVPFEGPPPRGFAPALPGGEGALGALFGGFGASRPVTDAWRLIR